ncbi:TspO/MBR family protein [Sphingomonas sp. Leaf21]|uniref:TspO/MBR family protein n=1 Tax=Sphingomonas sp. Leaf21 TaxID=2876550 RepID=UPI001E62BCAF|nr:TspO/MBR family protein [Sphingomonas sp. Leaf21]
MTDGRKTGFSPLVAGGVAVAVLGLSALVGRRNAPDPSHPKIRRWYRRLDKPGFTPPDKVFGAVWPVLETLATAGGYRLLRQPASPRRNAALALWLGNSAMIGGWTELFFRERRIGTSTVAAGTMAVGTAALAATAWKIDRPAAASVMPLATWLAFATILSGEVLRRNSRP